LILIWCNPTTALELQLWWYYTSIKVS